jgi:uncharacterized protein (UPF0276 family)
MNEAASSVEPTWDLLTMCAKLHGGHVVLLEEAMNLLNQSELRKW